MADQLTDTPAESTSSDSEADRVTGAAILRVVDLEVHFGAVRAVNGVSFEVQTGTAVGLIGPNGAGKSTALKAVGGETRPTSGRVIFDGIDLAGRPSHVAARAGMIRTFQLGGEFARLTVMENLLVSVPRQRGKSIWGALGGRRWWGAEDAAEIRRAREILSRLELREKENDYASDLSGGQRKLVEIGRALMARPKMLLLDEPMAGVNRSLARHIEHALSALRNDGLTLLLVEHELGSVERLCDRVLVMAGGRQIASGHMGQLRSRQEVLDAYLGGR
ncbi:ABC transporter ATP-binding protein [Acidiferrimicrobium sp. IK]|uniref:ABC transporter ATP-binding protein n=1 Tax=Acidiferrimicrobium sp. IK TaxID=2871700 RepID=UPI0021CAF9CA|nr:ABC transporter ATP-binding protein [Acidiferrimicrobium sp. IK]MCU4187248.1 ABC transporter ATP-binding protein [Acidiferrimicrobium sp. IK]